MNPHDPSRFSALDLSLFASRVDAICDDMGVVLRNTAFSPNIRDRLDYSCAIFDDHGELCAQAAHIPVHLGSMAFAMRDIVERMEWREGDQVILNDPFLGGTHLPDVTLIAPVFVEGELQGFVVNRAHHADIGAHVPGSMPVSSTLEEEGLVIEPVHLFREGRRVETVWERILGATRSPRTAEVDISAQLSANRTGIARLQAFIAEEGRQHYRQGLVALNDYGQRMARSALAGIPPGEYRFEDFLDDDGQGQEDILLKVCVRVDGEGVEVDFTGTADQVRGNVNCPLSVALPGCITCSAVSCRPRRRPAPGCSGTFIFMPRKAACSTPATRPRWPRATWRPAPGWWTWSWVPWRKRFPNGWRRPVTAA